MIPQFIIFKTLGWLNTHLPLIVPSYFTSAYFVCSGDQLASPGTSCHNVGRPSRTGFSGASQYPYCMHDSTATAYHHYCLPAYVPKVDNANQTEEYDMRCGIEGCLK